MADPENTTSSAQLAKRRYFIIQAVRIAGIAVILLGIYLRQVVGMDVLVPLLLVMGGGWLFILIPRMLARRWRSPDA